MCLRTAIASSTTVAAFHFLPVATVGAAALMMGSGLSERHIYSSFGTFVFLHKA